MSVHLSDGDYQKIQDAIYDAVLRVHQTERLNEQLTDRIDVESPIEQSNLEHTSHSIVEKICSILQRHARWCAKYVNNAKFTQIANSVMASIGPALLTYALFAYETCNWIEKIIFRILGIFTAGITWIVFVGLYNTDDKTATNYFNKLMQSFAVIIALLALIVAIYRP